MVICALVSLFDTNMARIMLVINSARTLPARVTVPYASVIFNLQKLTLQRLTCSRLTTIFSGRPFQGAGSQRITAHEEDLAHMTHNAAVNQTAHMPYTMPHLDFVVLVMCRRISVKPP